MKTVEALDAVTFGPGNILKLSAKQSTLRAARLKPLEDDGTFETLAEVQFKKGETFGVAGEIPKSLREYVTIDGKPGKPVPVVVKRAKGESIKFVMPAPGDTPAAIRAQLDKADQPAGIKKGK